MGKKIIELIKKAQPVKSEGYLHTQTNWLYHSRYDSM
jgi:hypothetical protein